jgi:hypothetical protein
MSSSAQHSRRPAGKAVRIARSLILVATLIPVTVFFVQFYRTSGDEKSLTERERHGVEYLTSLWQLTLSLTEAQSAVVSGRPPANADAVPVSLAAVGLIDERLGAELRTRERWAELRTKIESLPTGPGRDASAAYTGYTEATEMLLALYGQIKENAELIQDPDADAYFLQDTVAEQLPRMLVAAGRLTDLAHLVRVRVRADDTSTIATLTVVRTAVTDPAKELTNDLRSAVDGAQSRTLSGTLLSQLETFGRRMDTFTSVSAPTATEVVPDATAVDNARTDLQFAARDLGNAILLELDGLFADRIGNLSIKQWFAVGAMALAVLLVVSGVALPYVHRRRSGLERRSGPQERPGTDPGQPFGGPVRRALVTTSAGPEMATGAGQSGLGRSDAAR